MKKYFVAYNTKEGFHTAALTAKGIVTLLMNSAPTNVRIWHITENANREPERVHYSFSYKFRQVRLFNEYNEEVDSCVLDAA